MEWTDGRLDDLARRVDDGFKEVKGDIARLDEKIDVTASELRGEITGVRAEITGVRAEIVGLRGEIKTDIQHLDGKLNALLVAIVAGVLGLIGIDISGLRI